MKRILVLNLGSTSFKFKLMEMGDTERAAASGAVESVGGEGRYAVEVGTDRAQGECACATHLSALQLCMQAAARLGLRLDMAHVDAVGYKAVHGGRISGVAEVDDALMAEMERMVCFAPVHNPVYLAMMRAVRETYPGVRQIACFETAFHATIPPERVVYGVPYEWVQQYGIRRYGFHGASHSYIAWKLAQLAPEARRVVNCHLGGSSSLCAIQDGKSVATSMGATLQSGLVQNNRVGDFDAFCLPALAGALGGMDKVLGILSSEGGLKGVSGVSNDMRKIRAAAQSGNARARLAIDAFTEGIVGTIGMYAALMGGLDAVVFTGGIGRGDAQLRRDVISRLGFLGAKLDAEDEREGKISAPDSRVSVWALTTDEERMVARGCMTLLR